MYFCYANIKKKESTESHCFLYVFENFIIHETRLSAIFRKPASFRSRRFPKPRISTVFRISQKITSITSRESTENRMTKRMSFHRKTSEVCDVYRFRYNGTKRMGLCLLPAVLFADAPERIRLEFWTIGAVVERH